VKPPSSLLGPHLQSFFTEHLTRNKRVSPQTIASMRDSFRILLEFLRAQTGIEPAKLQVTDLNSSAILAFLYHLEQKRGNSVRSRNVRLSAIRTFFRYLALYDPDHLGQVTQVMAIPVKRQDKKLVGALNREEMDAILAAPDRSTWGGRRDHALLLTMYNTGAAGIGDDHVAEGAGSLGRDELYRIARQRTQGAYRAIVATYRRHLGSMVQRAGDNVTGHDRISERPRASDGTRRS